LQSFFRGWNEEARRGGKRLLAVFVIGLTNDVKFCCDKTASSTADYPRDVAHLLEYADTTFGQWARKMQVPLVYGGAAASYRINPLEPTTEVRLDNVDGAGSRAREHAKAMARIYQKVDLLGGGRGGGYSSFQANRVYYAQKPMTDPARCDEKGHPHLTETYLQGCLMYNTVVFFLQKGGVYKDLKCKMSFWLCS
jgi:hypothetical protein